MKRNKEQAKECQSAGPGEASRVRLSNTLIVLLRLTQVYALAYSGLADCYNLQGLREIDPKEAFPRAKAAALKALEIDDTLAEAHNSLGFVKHRFDWDWPSAEREFKRAVELKPGYATVHQWYGLYFVSVGQQTEAITELKRAQELDPFSLEINTDLGITYYYSRQYDQMIEQLQKTLEFDPNFWYTHFWLGKAYEQKRMYEEAVSAYLKAATLRGDSPEAVAARRDAYEISGWRGYLQRRLDQFKEQSKQGYISPYTFAASYARLGDREQALASLEKAIPDRSPYLAYLELDPDFDSLRSDPRYADLLRRIGLAP